MLGNLNRTLPTGGIGGGGGGGTVTSVSASSPLASSGGATPNITLVGPVNDALIRGGYHADVASTTDRNALPSGVLKEGMLVYVRDGGGGSGIAWKLLPGFPASPPPVGDSTTDADWAIGIPSSAIIGGGNPQSVAFWLSATTLLSNVNFLKLFATGLLYNAEGLTVGQNVTTQRYVDNTAGSDANSGLIASPWATIQHALDESPSVAPGIYEINVAVTGIPYNESLRPPDIIGSAADTTHGKTFIDIIGDEAVPANVVINSASGCFVNASSRAAVRFRGFRFTGNGGGVAWNISRGSLYFRNCEGDNFSTAGVTTRSANFIYEASTTGGTWSNLQNGFFANLGGFNSINASLTFPSYTTHALHSALGGQTTLGSGLTFTATGSGGGAASFVQAASGGRLAMGNTNTFTVDNVIEPFREVNGGIMVQSSGNTWNLNDCTTVGRITETSIFVDSADGSTTYNLTGTTPQTVRFGDLAYFYSQDIPRTYLSLFQDTNATFATDYRYKGRGQGQHLGLVPPGITAYVTMSQLSSSSMPLYVATGPSIVDFFQTTANVSNGVGHTDIYTITLNGAPTAMTFDITNGLTNSTTANAVALVAGDLVGIQGEFDESSEAEDIMSYFTVRSIS
jgi:hypothetical protein